MMIHKDFAQRTGREVCEKLKDLIPSIIYDSVSSNREKLLRETIKGLKKMF